MLKTKTLAVLGLLLAAPLTLSACSAGASGQLAAPQRPLSIVQQSRTLPPALQGTRIADYSARAFWLAGHRQISLTTFGSGSCPTVPTGYYVTSERTLRLYMRDYKDQACTADLGPHTTVFHLPRGIDAKQSVHLYYTLPYEKKGFTVVVRELPRG